MSESMAFIGGVAVAGLAALVLLKGTNIQPNFAVAPQMPVVAPQVMPPQVQYPPGYYGQTQPIYPNQPPAAPNSDQRLEMEKLNMQMETLKKDNEQLKVFNQQLQGQVQNFNTQQQWQLAQQNNQQKAAAFQPQNPWWSSPMLWAVGGAALTIGGGVVVAGVLALFSPRQRPTRTVQVIHPYQGPTPPLVPVRRAEFLPASRVEARRVEAPEYDEMH
ncbi:MAG: heterocyst differentiation related protein [Nostoc sp. SerVER01]|uniref:heterocyst differentiation related protein n=1 Tax=Nostoc sp. CCY 9925 TaxID=3103865 RepID=UPI002AD75FCA|nr:heterocyst differentiation related protein [Nostoc sp. SerVER01]MDZ8026816.1 heterocyst differentiation related protein [Nostoc sp. DedQUE11]MDZ8076847.1 heterocyst differentiation related protein [Nostoc sp. DedQUE01]MDZ8080151.1 heterocyst differentiation related protein [Nostoc sp. DcaGUA01]MDZ8241841.1 heterocyst differentiation related protein [Nostoc sp. ChiQUE01a]